MVKKCEVFLEANILLQIYLSEITRMVFVEIDSVVVLTSSVTATSGMLAVFTDTSMTVGNVSTELPGLLFVGTHF